MLNELSPKIGKTEACSVRVVVETPRGSRHKYAYDPKSRGFALKMTLASGLAWPYDYGFIPGTLGDDGDPLDVLVLMDESTFAGCIMTVRILGGILLEKNGVRNNRFVSCLLPRTEVSLSTDGYADIEDLPPKLLEEIKQFLMQYSEERDNTLEFKGTIRSSEAMEMIATSRQRYKSES